MRFCANFCEGNTKLVPKRQVQMARSECFPSKLRCVIVNHSCTWAYPTCRLGVSDDIVGVTVLCYAGCTIVGLQPVICISADDGAYRRHTSLRHLKDQIAPHSRET